MSALQPVELDEQGRELQGPFGVNQVMATIGLLREPASVPCETCGHVIERGRRAWKLPGDLAWIVYCGRRCCAQGAGE